MIRTKLIRRLQAATQKMVQAPTRSVPALGVALGVGLAAGPCMGSPQQQNTYPAPIVRQAPPDSRRPNEQGHPSEQPRPNQQPRLSQQPHPTSPNNDFAPHSGQNHEHLQQWMQSHGNLTLNQQQRALDNEPGFRQLDPEVQQRMHQRLEQLDNMTPQQRQRAYARTEAMERLAPERRQQVRNALTSLGALPRERRMYVAREFRAIRDLPLAECQAFLNAPATRAQFSEQERQTLNGLCEVSRYLPPPAQPAGPGLPMQGPMPPR